MIRDMPRSVLEVLLKRRGFVSEAELARPLRVSRATIDKVGRGVF
jgi:biotin operon repressor